MLKELGTLKRYCGYTVDDPLQIDDFLVPLTLWRKGSGRQMQVNMHVCTGEVAIHPHDGISCRN